LFACWVIFCNFLYETPLGQINEKEMKKIISKLVKYDEDYLIFKVDEESMKDIPNEAVIYIKGVIVDENQVVFNNKFVKNVKDENNNIIANPAGERLRKGLMVAGCSCLNPVLIKRSWN